MYSLPIAVQTVLPLATLPLTTLVLTPADYGEVAFAMAFISAASVFCSFSPQLQFASIELGGEDAHDEITTLTALVFATSSLAALLLLLAWYIGMRYQWLPVPLTPLEVALAAAALPLGSAWVVARALVVLRMSSTTFAVVSTLRAVLGALVVLGGLFIWHLHVVALYAGLLVAALVDFVGAMTYLAPWLRGHVRRRMLAKIIPRGMHMSAGAVTNALYSVVERSILASAGGAAALGIYAHAQNYQDALVKGTEPARQVIWPKSLAAARGSGSYENARAVWSLIWLGVTGAGLVFALYGKDIVALLTNGRFVDAAPIAALLIATLLATFQARLQLAVLFVHGASAHIAAATFVSNAVGLLVLVLAVPAFHAFGAVAGMAVRQLLLAAAVHVLARRFRRTPFEDTGPLVAFVGIALTLYGVEAGLLGPSARLALLVLSGLVLSFTALTIALPLWRYLVRRPALA